MQARSRTVRLGGLAAVVTLAAAAQLACGRTDNRADRAADGGSAAVQGPATETASVTLTGCMERGAIPGSFVLTQADSGDRADRADGATGTAGSSRAAYTVMSGEGRDLGEFVGKRVRVEGRFVVAGDPSGRTRTGDTVASPGETAGPDAPPGTPGVPGSRASAPGTVGSGASAATADSTAATEGPAAVPTRQLTANEVREISGTCSPGAAGAEGRRP